ncbi:hypothetical protein GA0074692_2231 [Micromonospora pallida]|uniref:Uncharacterized protein n=1 Tax=Micromonospora pallida TaxID=145854 RepID=A0A1C6SBC5_9ACTN|nr:hypothetical protein [Micromonospora pallida]SCL26781.1 hypothetical protein GA0074692_2231 [Micromonospora pallida]
MIETTGLSIPDPLPERVGHVGGIESLALDGVRYYFGFDFSSDLVVSPLIDDPAVMAAFASRHLRQTTGAHDAAYWAELVGWATEESSLVPTEEDRRFTTDGVRANRLTPDDHLLYLLAAATTWDGSLAGSPQAGPAYARLGFAEDELPDCLDHCVAVIRADGPDARPDEVTVVSAYLEHAAGRVPGNWGLLFGPLLPA